VSMLAPLARGLERPIKTIMLRRAAAWLACSVIALSVGTATAAILHMPANAQLGMALAALSALPAFLLWPLPAGFPAERLRELDPDTVMEAFLEAPPGPARELLRSMTAERAATIPLRRERRKRSMAGLGGLFAAAVAAAALLQVASLALTRRPLIVYGGPPPTGEGGRRIEDERFGPAPGLESEAPMGERRAEEASGSDAATDGGTNLEGGTEDGRPEGLVAPRRRSRAEEAFLPEQAADGEGGRRASAEAGEGRAEAGEEEGEPVPGEAEQGGAETSSRGEAGRRGEGFEKTGDTRVPSPLLDYRSRFESVYTARMGKRITADERLGLGELRDYQLQYFRSFSLSSGIAAGEDPYEASLRRRWRELREAHE
jgi:hypothetical protein